MLTMEGNLSPATSTGLVSKLLIELKLSGFMLNNWTSIIEVRIGRLQQFTVDTYQHSLSSFEIKSPLACLWKGALFLNKASTMKLCWNVFWKTYFLAIFPSTL